MVCYLTDHTDPDDLAQGFASGVWVAAKWYPARATTNAHHGVTDPLALVPCLQRMAQIGMPLCVHGEVTDPSVDIFEREQVFLDTILGPMLDQTGVRCVVEHATTAHAVAFVRSRPRVAATITPHHLWWNRNALFEGGLRPHAYCLPVLKREQDRQALIEAATSGDPRFFAGTDSAPHLVSQKEKDCGCAGVFNAPTAIAAYAQIFEEASALAQLEGFLSLHGAAFYGEEPASERVTLRQQPWTPPEQIEVPGHGAVRVFLGGSTLRWNLDAAGA
jgi:dihydroorotase